MKTLTLNEAWRLCLKQWKWIVGQKPVNVEVLKRRWCRENGFEDIKSCCFFCEYAKQNVRIEGEIICQLCPGRLVDKDFGCCSNPTYHYRTHPKEFLAKLLELHKIFLQMEPDKKRKSKKVK